MGNKLSLFASAVLVASSLLAAYALFANATPGQSDSPKPTQREIQPASPTSTVVTPAATGRGEAGRLLQSESPVTLEAIEAVERRDLAALKDLLLWREFPCSTLNAPSIAPSCSELGLTLGTKVPMFLYELTEYSYRPQQETLSILDDLLRPEPKLALAARRSDGSYLIAFTLGPSAPGQPRGVNFTVAGDAGGKFSSYTEKFAGSTPLDDLREFDRRNGVPSQLLYLSGELRAWEADKHQLQSNPAVMPNQKP